MPYASPSVVLGIYGAGGFGREVIELANQSLVNLIGNQVDYKIFFIETIPKLTLINGFQVISEQDFLSINCEKKYFTVAIANSKLREKLAYRLIKSKIEPISICSDKASISKYVDLAVGHIICDYSSITSNVKIGKFFHGNINSVVSHDSVIGDFVSFAPGAVCLGNVIVENYAYIGAGSILKQGSSEEPLVIGQGALIGMGAVVTKNVKPHTTVVGIPAREL
jgi:sugar O-acyltransferase (sialic acid O-acetyltransferase NeuD family)